MNGQREPEQIIGRDFTQSYLYGKMTLGMPSEVPDKFCKLIDEMRIFDYGLTNPLREDSCLILPESRQLIEPLRTAQLPLFLDTCMKKEYLAELRDVGRELDGGYAENNYVDIARIVARESGPSVVCVSAFEWNNEDLQRGLIEFGKHYSIGLQNRDMDM